MKLSIGETIAADIKKNGLSVTYVAQQIGMSRKGLADVLKRNDMSLSQLLSLSEILNRDYFELYKQNVQKERGIVISTESADKIEEKPEIKKEVSLSINICGEIDLLNTHFANLLALIKAEAEDRGLHLG